MDLTGLFPFIVGVLIVVCSFVLALYNMHGAVSGDKLDISNFSGMFARHLGAMAGFLLGGLTAAGGLLWLVYSFLVFNGWA